jgi:hypothetical protein
VHRDHCRPFGAVIIETNGIEGFVISLGEPLEIIKPVEVILVNNCEFAFGKADFAVVLAEFVFAIQKHRPRENPVNPIRNTDC